MANRTPITVANGDGIGPEIMAATLQVAVTFNLRNYEGKAAYTLAQGQ
jgi:isocitrate/isopropylmalate dehydrogenase